MEQYLFLMVIPVLPDRFVFEVVVGFRPLLPGIDMPCSNKMLTKCKMQAECLEGLAFSCQI